MNRTRSRFVPWMPPVSATVALLCAAALGAGSARAAVTYSVNCDKGDKISTALATARTILDPVSIFIQGVCKERIVIDRNDLTLVGVDATAGLDGATIPSSAPVIRVAGATRVEIRRLRLSDSTSSAAVLGLDQGSHALADGLSVIGGWWGVKLTTGAELRLWHSDVHGAGSTGIEVLGGELSLSECAVFDNGGTGIAVAHGTLSATHTRISANRSVGVLLTDDTSASLSHSELTENRMDGLQLVMGARAGLGGCTVADNEWGIRLNDLSTVSLSTGSVVERNRLHGMMATGASLVLLGDKSVVRGNGLDGISVFDTSLLRCRSCTGVEISGNSGWGVTCEAFPGDARLAPPGLDKSAVFGNALGQINCPGYVVP